MTSNFSIQQSLIEYDFNMTYEKQNTEYRIQKNSTTKKFKCWNLISRIGYEQIGITLYKSV